MVCRNSYRIPHAVILRQIIPSLVRYCRYEVKYMTIQKLNICEHYVSYQG